MVRRRSSWQPDGGLPATAPHACWPSPASRAPACAVRGGSEDGYPRAASWRLPPARTATPARHRPAGDRRARQQSWQLRGLRFVLAMSASQVGRVGARRVLNPHQPQGRHWTRDFAPRDPVRRRCRPCSLAAGECVPGAGPDQVRSGPRAPAARPGCRRSGCRRDPASRGCSPAGPRRRRCAAAGGSTRTARRRGQG
jgi:hypothetical protein